MAAAQRARENIKEEKSLLEDPQPDATSSGVGRGGFNLGCDHRQGLVVWIGVGRLGGVGGCNGGKGKKNARKLKSC